MWPKILCTTGKISDFTAACPREGNTCSFLEQDVILPSNWRLWYEQSVMLPPCACSLFWGQCGGSLTFITWAPTTPGSIQVLWVPFAEAFPDRTGQSSAFIVPFSASMLISRARITEEMDQQTPQPHCGCMQCGRACIAQQGQNSLRTSSWEPLSNSKFVNEWDVLSDVVKWRRSHSISANSKNKNQGRDWRSGRELGRHFLYPAMSPSVDSPFHTCSTYSSAPWELEI